MKVEVAVLGSPSLISLVVSVDIKHSVYYLLLSKLTEFRSCVKVEVAVLGSPSLISLVVSVDVKHSVYLYSFGQSCQSSGAV